ncbi:MAG: lysylphosphatidylglycerol synthase transmembrane domain-containing protein [Dehalococcoidia bacterium]
MAEILEQQRTRTPMGRSPGRRSLVMPVATGALVLALTVWFIAANRAEIPAAILAVRSADALFLALAALLSVAFMLNLAAFHQATYLAVGLRIPFWTMVRLSAAGHFLNLVSKAGGMGGLLFYLRDARRRQQSRGLVVTSYLLATLLGHFAFGAVMVVGLAVVWADGALAGPELVAGAVYGLYLVGHTAVLITAARSRTALRFLHALPARLARRARALAGRPGPAAPLSHTAADELHDAVTVLVRRPRAMLAPGFHALLLEAIGVAMLWLVLRAFSVNTGPGLPLVGYSFVVLFTIVSLLPAGVGTAEVSLGVVLIAFGVSGATAAVVVAAFRLCEIWIPFALGGWAAQSLARERAP